MIVTTNNGGTYARCPQYGDSFGGVCWWSVTIDPDKTKHYFWSGPTDA